MNELQILSMRDELEKIGSFADKAFNFLHKNPVGKVVHKGLTPIVEYGTRLSGSQPRKWGGKIKEHTMGMHKDFKKHTDRLERYLQEDLQKEIKFHDSMIARAKSPELKKLREESKQRMVAHTRELYDENLKRRKDALAKELSGPPGSAMEHYKKLLADSTAETAQTRKRTALASGAIVGGGILYNRRRKK